MKSYKEQGESSLNSLKKASSRMKSLVSSTGLAVLMTLSSCDKRDIDSPKSLGDFELVDTKVEDSISRDIYEYTMQKGDYPVVVANKFNAIDQKSGDKFMTTGSKNIVEDKNLTPIVDKNKVFNVGDVVYIKAKKFQEKASTYTYAFNKPDKPFRNETKSNDIERKSFPVTINGKSEKVKILQDAWLTFYVVQESDFYPTPMIANGSKVDHCINFEKIRQKLMKIDEFSYLKDPMYQRSEQTGKNTINLKNKLISFNINPADIDQMSKDDIKKGNLYIPLPTSIEDRSMDIQEFAYYAQEAIEEIQNNKNYAPAIKELLSKASKEEVLEALLTYAYNESSPQPQEKLGRYELHRWEGNDNNAFSFTYFHVLMTKDSPGLKARLKLGLTEGECYHPKNAAKLFLGFWAEKAEEMSKPLSHFFPLNKDTYDIVARAYNGRNYKENNYDKNIKDNHQKVIRLLKNYKK